MTNSEAGRKAFEEVFSKWEDPNDKNKAWKGWRDDRESLLAVLESPECVEEVAKAIHDSLPTVFSWKECSEGTRIITRGKAKAAISTIINKLKEK